MKLALDPAFAIDDFEEEAIHCRHLDPTLSFEQCFETWTGVRPGQATGSGVNWSDRSARSTKTGRPGPLKPVNLVEQIMLNVYCNKTVNLRLLKEQIMLNI